MKRPDAGFLKRLREIAGENMTEFSRRLGMSQSKVWGYVSGNTVPSYEFFVRLIQSGIDLNWLFTGKTSSNDVAASRRVAEEQEKYGDIKVQSQQMAVLLSELGKTDREVALAMIERMVEVVRGNKKKVAG